MIRHYLLNLSTGKVVLWCYLIWYLTLLVHYFDPSPGLWITSLGISGIVGVALILSTASAGSSPRRADPWVTFRLFLMPFCVSSFSALVKGQGFVLIFSPRASENLLALGCIAAFVGLVTAVKRFSRPMPASQPARQN